MIKILLILFVAAVNLTAQVNGSIEYINNKKVLFLWGTHSERGYAHGYLAGENIKEALDEYFVEFICGGQRNAYSFLRNTFINYFEVESKYIQEAQSIINGMSESGTDLYNNTLQRSYDHTDLLMMAALPDIGQLAYGVVNFKAGCSSISSWGSSTENDSNLNGKLVITRLMDWNIHESLCNNHTLIVNLPSEVNEQPWMSFAFTGFMGALSAINESGVATFMNEGNITTYSLSQKFNPVLLSVRNGIESADQNGDGICNDIDILDAVEKKVHGGASIIHTIFENGEESNPFVIEVNNENGCAVRKAEDNISVNGRNLAATNHFRKLYEPEACSRYARIIDSLSTNTDISIERSRKLLAGAGGGSHNVHAIQYIPSLDKVYWATATMTSNAYENEYSELNVSALLNHTTDINDVEPVVHYRLYQNYPNPFNPQTEISFDLDKQNSVSLTVYDIQGGLVTRLLHRTLDAGNYSVSFNGSNLASGIYLYKLSISDKAVITKKMLLLK